MTELLPRIGGHRVRQGALGNSKNAVEVLSHDDLDLDAVELRLEPGESYQSELDRRHTMLLIVSGDAELTVGERVFALNSGDAVDIVNAVKMSMSAHTEVMGLVVKGSRG